LVLYKHQHGAQAARWNLRLPDSVRLLQQGKALNKTTASRPVLHSHQ
jgi:hypothetical protein